MLPTVTCEEWVHPFSFYFEHEIHQGMTYQGTLNFLVKTFHESSRDKAYELAMRLGRQNITSMVTVSSHVHPICYRVWVDMSMVKAVIGLDELAHA
jgi:hypothetical protein